MTLRRARELLCIFDDMILSHFCVVRIRVFRHGRDGCAFLLGSTLLPRYLLHCYADSSTCCCQAHTQVFQSLPKRKLNLFSMVFFVTHTFPFFVSLWRTFFFYRMVRKKPLAPCANVIYSNSHKSGHPFTAGV